MKLFLAVTLTIAAAAQTIVTLPAGTPLRLAAARTLTSDVDRPGDTLNFEVLEAVRIGGVELIAPGTTVSATVVTARSVGTHKKGGALQVKLRNLQMPGGISVALGLASPGGSAPMQVSIAGVAPATLTPSVSSTYSVYGASTEAVIIRGFQLTAYVQESLVVDADKLRAPHMVTAAPRPLTNADVIEQVQAGRAETEILAAIGSTPGNYLLGATEIAALKRAGLTSRIIEAMLAVAAGR